MRNRQNYYNDESYTMDSQSNSRLHARRSVNVNPCRREQFPAVVRLMTMTHRSLGRQRFCWLRPLCLHYPLCNISTNWWFNPSRKHGNYAANYRVIPSMSEPLIAIQPDAFIYGIFLGSSSICSLNHHFFLFRRLACTGYFTCWIHRRRKLQSQRTY